jgi:hypothetical protein
MDEAKLRIECVNDAVDTVEFLQRQYPRLETWQHLTPEKGAEALAFTVGEIDDAIAKRQAFLERPEANRAKLPDASRVIDGVRSRIRLLSELRSLLIEVSAELFKG